MTPLDSRATSERGSSSAFRVHRLSLAFLDRGYEFDFLQQYGLVNLRHWRICHVLAVAFYSAYVVIHAVTIPAKASAFYAIGFGGVAPMFLAGFLLTYRSWFRSRWQAINVVYFLATGAGALGMASAAGHDHSFFTLTGFLFCFLFGYAVIGSRFAHASAAGAVLTLAFLIRAPSLLGTDAAAYSLGILYVLGFNALGMLIAYYAELHTRREFHTRSLLEAEKLHFIAKPFNAPDLLKKVRMVLDLPKAPVGAGEKP